MGVYCVRSLRQDTSSGFGDDPQEALEVNSGGGGIRVQLCRHKGGVHRGRGGVFSLPEKTHFQVPCALWKNHVSNMRVFR